MIKKLVGVHYAGTLYLCEVHETEKKVELRNACSWKKNDEETIVKWITKHNLGELKSISLSPNSDYAVDPLSEPQKRLLRRLWEDMKEVKETALPRLENQYFMDDR